MALEIRMSVRKRPVAAAGWPLATAFRSDTQAAGRPCAAGDEAVAEAQGTNRGTDRHGGETLSLPVRCSKFPVLLTLAVMGVERRVAAKRGRGKEINTKCSPDANKQCAANGLVLAVWRVVWETGDRRSACQKEKQR